MKLPASYKPTLASLALQVMVAILVIAGLIPAVPGCRALYASEESAATAEGEATVGIEEKLGAVVPLDSVFFDEEGKEVRLGDLLDKPTILALVYYTCPGICSPLLGGVAEVVDRVDLEPGQDFRVITISFDPEDTPAVARAKKRNYMTTMLKERTDLPPDSWRWLTGKSESIKAVTEAVGFSYRKDDAGEEYLHSAAIVMLSPEGTICRYLYGTTFLKFDVMMALNEASRGEARPTITRLLEYCYSYDPAGRKYTLNLLRVIGATMSLTLIGFFLFLIFTGTKPHTPAEQQAR